MLAGFEPCCDRAMILSRAAKTWARGWHDLVRFGAIPGYKARSWLERKRLDFAAFWYLLGSVRFRCAVLSLVGVQLLVLSLAWHWDLAGWRRDLLRVAPALLTLPWLATARRVVIESLLRHPDQLISERAHRQPHY